MIIEANEPNRTYSVIETNGELAIISTFAQPGQTLLLQSTNIKRAVAFLRAYVESRLSGSSTSLAISDGHDAIEEVA